ncbi:hypothetical protein BU23DRAFT_562769 [Bimuria novae-zelandiae CBS 107.79]|uniref:Uncharacterized protein n=1 Tax=Bimuria novae-zelandiae CBS 107.79 TaxID=1447943 RepID=A0A6A5VXB1_9PLEO|nr:hypothetical protein BU23DRAFT_562769 [Bimuria novae-zelandiae CBS 107.79]
MAPLTEENLWRLTQYWKQRETGDDANSGPANNSVVQNRTAAAAPGYGDDKQHVNGEAARDSGNARPTAVQRSSAWEKKELQADTDASFKAKSAPYTRHYHTPQRPGLRENIDKSSQQARKTERRMMVQWNGEDRVFTRFSGNFGMTRANVGQTEKTAALKHFGKNFKLNTPVAVDLRSMLGKDMPQHEGNGEKPDAINESDSSEVKAKVIKDFQDRMKTGQTTQAEDERVGKDKAEWIQRFKEVLELGPRAQEGENETDE